MIDNCLSTIYVWGSTANGALGCPDKSAKVQLVPRRMSPCCLDLLRPQTVSSVIAGNGVTTLVTDRLDAFTWGKTVLKDCNVKAQKGNSCKCHRIPLADVTAVTHGSSHTTVIAGKGDVFGWGDLSACDLKINVAKSLSAPHHSAATKRKITKPRNIPLTCLLQRRTTTSAPHREQHFARQVACGDSHTCILMDDGTVLTMGRLRIGCNIAFANVHFEEIACGHNHCAAICRHRNAFYTWVRADHFALSWKWFTWHLTFKTLSFSLLPSFRVGERTAALDTVMSHHETIQR
jgi:alpha-tubulin suppressor-like RCC1 family protein